MKKTTLAVLLLAGLLAGSVNAQSKTIEATVTFYWVNELGGSYDCNGNRLHRGVAAVDFDVIPRGSVLDLGGVMTVTATDCGGSAVISRKASRARGCHAPVIDIWAPSEEAAMRMEKLFNSKGPIEVTYEAPHTRNSAELASRSQRCRISPGHCTLIAYDHQSSKPGHGFFSEMTTVFRRGISVALY